MQPASLYYVDGDNEKAVQRLFLENAIVPGDADSDAIVAALQGLSTAALTKISETAYTDVGSPAATIANPYDISDKLQVELMTEAGHSMFVEIPAPLTANLVDSDSGPVPADLAAHVALDSFVTAAIGAISHPDGTAEGALVTGYVFARRVRSKRKNP